MPPAFFLFRRSPDGCLFHPHQLAERAFDFAQLMRYPPTLTCLSRRPRNSIVPLASSSRDRRCDTSARPGASKLLLATQGIVEIAFRDPNAAIHNSPGTQSGQSRPCSSTTRSVGWLAENRKGWSASGRGRLNFAGVRPDRRLGGAAHRDKCPCGRKAR